MGRKRPPGGKVRGPTVKQPNPMQRMLESVAMGVCPEDSATSVLSELQSWFQRGYWNPPLPEKYSLFMLGDDSDKVAITAYRVPDVHVQTTMQWLREHPQLQDWQLEVFDQPEGFGPMVFSGSYGSFEG